MNRVFYNSPAGGGDALMGSRIIPSVSIRELDADVGDGQGGMGCRYCHPVPNISGHRLLHMRISLK
jgi:hypothetical protein